MARRALGLIVAALAAAVLTAVAAAAGTSEPRCFGAAARDPQRPCHNRHLRRVVRPTPNRALLTPNLACTDEQIEQTVKRCAFGADAATASATVAVLGDSHASALHPAFAVVAKRRNWRVLEFGVPHCPFSTAKPDSGQDANTFCPVWNGEVVDYLGHHPEIQTVIMTANVNAPIKVPPGANEFATRVADHIEEINRLPASVTHIVVIRDDPLDRLQTFDCVRRAIKHHRPAGTACAYSRHGALRPDAEVKAAAQLHDRGARVVDLSAHYCNATRCFPVVGGVLVHKDLDHLGQLWARTLGPFLDRGIGAALSAR